MNRFTGVRADLTKIRRKRWLSVRSNHDACRVSFPRHEERAGEAADGHRLKHRAERIQQDPVVEPAARRGWWRRRVLLEATAPCHLRSPPFPPI